MPSTKRVSEAIAEASMKPMNSAKIDLVMHGSVTFIIQDGKVVRYELRTSELNRETA